MKTKTISQLTFNLHSLTDSVISNEKFVKICSLTTFSTRTQDGAM